VNLVDDDESTGLRSQESVRIFQAAPIGRALEIEVAGSIRTSRGDRASECRLADLTRAEQHDRGHRAQPRFDPLLAASS
jgi:hypothetical protein